MKDTLKEWLADKGFLNNDYWSTLIWIDDKQRVHEIIVEFCIGDFCVGYFIDRGLRDGKVRCNDGTQVKKAVNEFKDLYSPAPQV